MKEFIRLLREYRTTSNKKAYFLVILEMSGKIQFPKYSLIQLLNSIGCDSNEIISSEGWIETDVDSKLTKLQKERKKIEKEKIDLKKARLEFEEALKEAKQTADETTNNNSNTPIIKSIDNLEKTSNFNNGMNQPQVSLYTKTTIGYGILSIVFSIPLVFSSKDNVSFSVIFFLIGIYFSLLTITRFFSYKEKIQKGIESGKFNISLYNQLKIGVILGFIPLGLGLIIIFLTILG